MLKQLLIIISIFGISFCQIQRGGTPTYFSERIDEVNFIRISQDNVVDRNFHPMVFEFGIEYDVNINVIENATVIENNGILTYLLGLESDGAYGIGVNFDQFKLTEN